MTNHHRILHSIASGWRVAGSFCLIVLLIGPIAAQSGRRAPRSSSPHPTPTPEATPEQKKPVAETKAAVSLIVGMDRGGDFASVPMYFYDTVLRACAERLDASPSVDVDVASRDLNRGEAIKRAKAETDSHVVLMQVRFDSPMGRNEDFTDLFIEYWVFAPTTAKVVTSGRTYQQIGRAGGIIMMPTPGGRASVPYAEQLLKQAARDAADRILSAMHLPGRTVPG
jgi:hypothetical protein